MQLQRGGFDMSGSADLQKQLSSLNGSLDFGTDALSQHLVNATTMNGYDVPFLSERTLVQVVT